MAENRREFFRVLFNPLINGEVSIIEGGSFISVKIDNLSICGMGFISNIDIPMHQKVECSFNILDSSFTVEGFIIRKNAQTNYVEYGVAFEIDQETSSELFKQLNYYQIRQRRGHLED
ncbi:PilZ domain-containing protein [Bacillus taeanensis]|uniref:PilZ domain-containing protein n=1 Tax=Bacillus taeanensis TaxID=273032 RepID=A0A366XQ39_9BACI|nr:PilZ domain-containing protein [Bacillus taeanensis]RBW67836.1 PilZ domain-containing protein [Bacillus taeanensis]